MKRTGIIIAALLAALLVGMSARIAYAEPINHPAYQDGCWDSTGVPYSVGGNHGLGECLAETRKGWTGAQFRCLSELWGRLESGWNQHADNPRSSAHGIPQALPGRKMGPGWQHDVRVQVNWGLDYIEGKYGNPCRARAVRLAKGGY